MDESDIEQYQTVFACRAGAIAAPTAGLHFTDELLAQLTRSGIHVWSSHVARRHRDVSPDRRQAAGRA